MSHISNNSLSLFLYIKGNESGNRSEIGSDDGDNLKRKNADKVNASTLKSFLANILIY